MGTLELDTADLIEVRLPDTFFWHGIDRPAKKMNSVSINQKFQTLNLKVTSHLVGAPVSGEKLINQYKERKRMPIVLVRKRGKRKKLRVIQIPISDLGFSILDGSESLTLVVDLKTINFGDLE
ncbi:MAG: hypothetical protein GC178_13840 [Flavobacteriales bacterium]|nr:hypothetical protein [Flavobacteriales bacterium]